MSKGCCFNYDFIFCDFKFYTADPPEVFYEYKKMLNEYYRPKTFTITFRIAEE